MSLCTDGGESSFNSLVNSGSINTSGTLQDNQSREEFCKKIPETIKFIDEVLTTCREPFDLKKLNVLKIDLKFSSTFYCYVDASGNYCDEVIGRPEDSTKRTYKPFAKPYSQWDPNSCQSSCIAEMDKTIKTYISEKNDFVNRYSGYVVFSDLYIEPRLYSGAIYNPTSCCGTDDGTIGAENRCKPEITPDATTPSKPTSLIPIGDKKDGISSSSTSKGNSTNPFGGDDIDSGATTFTAQIYLLTLVLCLLFALFK